MLIKRWTKSIWNLLCGFSSKCMIRDRFIKDSAFHFFVLIVQHRFQILKLQWIVKITNYENTYILAWSTTPWNKIVTPALAVNPVLTYVTVEIENEKYILAQSTIKILDGLKYKILDTFKGEKIIGEFFEPHYTFYTIEKDKKAFIIIGGDFVTADEGTGVVTLAAYGEEDLEVMTKENIQDR